MGLAALFQAALALVTAPAPNPPPEPLARLTPREKAALVVVSGLPAPRGVGGVIVRRWDRDAPRPPDALVFVDQEGGDVRAFPQLPPASSASAFTSGRAAVAAGRATGRALRDAGVHVDLAPVVDLDTGPLGSRHFQRPALAVAFARGLEQGGVAACPKHFPGLGSAPITTDARPRVPARVLRRELDGFRAAVDAGVDCVMTSHALYDRFRGRRGLTTRETYRLLRRLGFEGVAITDSLSVVRGRWPVRWARRAALAGADLLLFTSPDDARRAIRALVPLARKGLLDEHVRRVRDLRRSWASFRPMSVWRG
ncbi:MAG TPA: glycoside hydrolase family 3 N-terminal domain-containing protein [Gaiellaceae bacterium]|nr:glycoside hydrolase family 3 N-terminal domain-containing protein [Gaiellaceae bacterium]